MKHHGILHPRLAEVVAAMGHGDTLCVADAGLPIPPEVERVDLAFAPGRPGFAEVVDAVLQELRIEAYVIADESLEQCPALVGHLRLRLDGAQEMQTSHETLKLQTRAARAVVRTGEFTPFANVILRSGVDFGASPSQAT